MMQLLNNILVNFNWANLIYFIATIIEDYLIITLLLLIFDISYSKKEKLIYMILVLVISKINSIFIPSPFNIISNYISMTLLIALIFKINLLKAFVTLIVTAFAFGVFNILIQNPYITLLGISSEEFIDTPKYRIPYLILFYFVMFCIIIHLFKLKKNKFQLDLLDALDRNTIFILCINLIVGFVTLFIQLVATAYYIEVIPIFISISNFLLLFAFFILSIYSYTRIIKLALTRKDLEYAEEYNKSLQILYDKVSGFKHDFDSMMFYLNGYVDANDMSGLKQYFEEMKKDYKIAHNLSLINPNIINNPGIYSLLNNKYFKASNSNITFDIDISLNIINLDVNMYKFSRILGILIDNAIEASEKCEEKIVKLSFFRENISHRAVISIKNTYPNPNVNINQIFEKEISSKSGHTGIGLWEVKRYVKKNKNIDLNTSKTEKFFIQELYVYD